MSVTICRILEASEDLSAEARRIMLMGAYFLYMSGTTEHRFEAEGVEAIIRTEGMYDRQESIEGLLFDAELKYGLQTAQVTFIVSKGEFLSAPPEHVRRSLATLTWGGKEPGNR